MAFKNDIFFTYTHEVWVGCSGMQVSVNPNWDQFMKKLERGQRTRHHSKYDLSDSDRTEKNGEREKNPVSVAVVLMQIQCMVYSHRGRT